MKKRIRSSYLYADGHAVLIWEKDDKDAGTVEFVEIFEKWTDAKLRFEGRIVFGNYDFEMMRLAKKAYAIEASEASLNRGSDNTKKNGIRVGSLTYEMSPGYSNSLCWTTMPDLISCSFTYQPLTSEPCPKAEDYFWSAKRISKFHKAESKPTLSEIAA